MRRTQIFSEETRGQSNIISSRKHTREILFEVKVTARKRYVAVVDCTLEDDTIEKSRFDYGYG